MIPSKYFFRFSGLKVTCSTCSGQCSPDSAELSMIVIQTVPFLILIVIASSLQEGEDCTLQNSGQKGTCLNVFECEDAKKLLQSNQRPQHCGFNRHTELVCCPIHTSAALQQKHPPRSKSDEMCSKYHDEKNQLLGVAKGEQASAKEFPHVAAIGYFNGQTVLWLCGGSLISEQYVLTAAHCTNSKVYGTPTFVRLGDLDLKNDTDDAAPRDVFIDKIHTHPQYQSSSVYHDIALLQLREAQRFDLYVKPACLHLNENIPTDILQVVGWGKTDFHGEGSSHLMKANVSVVSYERCAATFAKDKTRLKDGILDEMQICAGDSEGRDTCPGDSGGPLHFQKDCGNCPVLPHFAVVGVTSFGKGCGLEDSVGVYLRVAPYVGWIEKIVWK